LPQQTSNTPLHPEISLIETLGLEAKEILGNNKPKRYIN